MSINYNDLLERNATSDNKIGVLLRITSPSYCVPCVKGTYATTSNYILTYSVYTEPNSVGGSGILGDILEIGQCDEI